MKSDLNQIPILAIDNDPECNELIGKYLKANGYQVTTTIDPSTSIELLKSEQFKLVITEIEMSHISGFDIIRHIKENYKEIPIIVLTNDLKIKDAVKAVKMGAVEYLEKPFSERDLSSIVERAILNSQNKRKFPPIQFKSFHRILGNSKPMQTVYKIIQKAASTTATVLITGETGTGKELVARAIHYNESSGKAPFIPVNCGSIPETLLESELFGYVKGAFTGANDTRQGFFQSANNGTIFLDEISETPLAMQVKLLRVIQEKQFHMVGSRTSQTVNIRIIAATNSNIKSLVNKKLFREDLYYRLNVIDINLPPLRERSDDISTLINFFIKKYSAEFDKKQPIFTEAALDSLKKHSWPGNIRELENVIQRLIIMTEGELIDIPDLPEHLRFSPNSKKSPIHTLEDNESEYIHRVLTSTGNNKTQAAMILGIDRKTLREKIQKLKMPSELDED